MVIVPDSDIILIKSPLKLDNNNQLTFSSTTEQYNYFISLPHLEYDDCTYQRKDGVIRYATGDNLRYEDLLQYNYCIYKNDSYKDKWFYAFITGVTYINDGMTELTIETDVFQTWQFDIVYYNSFIEREHVSDDTVGLHTLPESLDTGDFISTTLQPTFSPSLETCFVIAVTELLSSMSTYTTYNQLLPIGLYYIGVENLNDIKNLIEMYDTAGKGEAVNSVFVIPKSFFRTWTTFTGVTGKLSFNIQFDYQSDIFTINRPSYVGNNYIPKNNRLLSWPYSYLQVSNHSGQVINYKWENFNLLQYEGLTPTIKFILKGTFTPGGSFKLFPINYNNILNNYDDTINLGKYPIGAYTNDVYTNWLTQNGVNLGFTQLNASEAGYILGGTQTLLGLGALYLGSPSGAETAINGLGRVIETFQSDYRHSMIPDTVSGNVNSGDVNFAFGINNLEFKTMTIKNEYAECIDNFFSIYGYKVNELKVPNIHKRSNWDYIKCIGVNLEGNIPEVDLNKIRNMFNNGCTFWHTTTYYLDYSRNNTIL